MDKTMTPRKYTLEGDVKRIYDKSFFTKVAELQQAGKVKIIQYGGGSRPHILHIYPGLTVQIQEETFPLIAYGTDDCFKEGISILEELLGGFKESK